MTMQHHRDPETSWPGWCIACGEVYTVDNPPVNHPHGCPCRDPACPERLWLHWSCLRRRYGVTLAMLLGKLHWRGKGVHR